jgi:hypothetical protein
MSRESANRRASIQTVNAVEPIPNMMNQSKATEIVKSLTPADILQVYSGKPGCHCGCNGRYFVRQAAVAAVAESDGYAPSDEDVKDKVVARLVEKVQAGASQLPYQQDINEHDKYEPGWNVADDLQYVTAVIHRGWVYTVYLTKEARRSRGVEKGFDL